MIEFRHTVTGVLSEDAMEDEARNLAQSLADTARAAGAEDVEVDAFSGPSPSTDLGTIVPGDSALDDELEPADDVVELLDVNSLAFINFASDEAAELSLQRGLTRSDFDGVKATAKTGYSLADVRGIGEDDGEE